MNVEQNKPKEIQYLICAASARYSPYKLNIDIVVLGVDAVLGRLAVILKPIDILPPALFRHRLLRREVV